MDIHTSGHPHIFLLGMMGSGKSFWGNILAANYPYAFYDLDDVIENEERKTISEIFRHFGEKYFRDVERDCLRKFATRENFILATGGGTPCFHNNMEWMNKNGTTIFINEPIDVLVKRLLPEKSHRPLIKDLNDDELNDFLSKKFTERFSVYSQAQYHLEGNNISENSFSEILKPNA